MTDDRDQNPFQSPAHVADETHEGGKFSREVLRRMVRCQKVAIVSGHVQIVSVICLFLMPILFPILPSIESMRFAIPLFILATFAIAIVAGALAGSFIAAKVYHPLPGFFLGVLSLLPLVGNLALYCIIKRATDCLRQNGIRVGFLGAELGKI